MTVIGPSTLVVFWQNIICIRNSKDYFHPLNLHYGSWNKYVWNISARPTLDRNLKSLIITLKCSLATSISPVSMFLRLYNSWKQPFWGSGGRNPKNDPCHSKMTVFLRGQNVKAHSAQRGYIPLAIKAISVASRKKGVKNSSRYTTLNILVSSCRSSRRSLREASPLRCLSKVKRGTRRCPFIFSSRGGDSEAYVSRALGKDEPRSETKGPDGLGAHHLPGCNLKREPTGTGAVSFGIISTLLDYARIYTTVSPFTLTLLSRNVSLFCVYVRAFRYFRHPDCSQTQA